MQAKLIGRIKEIPATRVRAMAIGAFMCCCAERVGEMNTKRVNRFYGEMGLQFARQDAQAPGN
jgi:hypothetical protein